MIIESRLDNDLYQFTMSQLFWKHFKETKVRYEFRNRTFSVPLATCFNIQVLQGQLDSARQLSFTASDINWLRTSGYFEEEYLTWLRNDHKLPTVEVSTDNGHLVIEYEGEWADAVFWETMVLSIVTELYYRRFEALATEGYRRLDAKIEYLAQHPTMKFVEFGTRRRYSRAWQETVVNQLIGNPFTRHNLIATSNCWLAHEYGLDATGTMAHQGLMVAAALAKPQNELQLMNSQFSYLDLWRETYISHPELLTLLPDTFGTKWFVAIEDLPNWCAIRQDSGDPFEIGEFLISNWQKWKMDPLKQKIVFSDGLNIRTMSMLLDRFGTRTNVVFGWGTNLTNDLGFESLSLVIKPKSANGIPCVKLSDNPAKATGTPEEIERYKDMLKYDITQSIAPKY